MSSEMADPMMATEQEKAWAIAIKSTVEADEKLDNLTDMEYLQHAIVAKEKVEKALKRVKRMQAYKKKYGIAKDGDDYEAGWKVIQQFFDQQPGMMTGIGIDTKGRLVSCFDYKKFMPKKVKTEEDWKIFMGAFFYMFQALQPNVAAIRDGTVWICDCKGMGWDNFSLEIEKRGAEFYSDAYPMRIKELAMIDAPKIINAMYNLIKVFLSQKIKDSMCFEKKESYFESRKGVYPADVLPEPLGGTANDELVAKRFQEYLKQRCDNIASFKL